MNPSLAAVIFDVDGVLVQSMERNYEAYRRVLEPLGIQIAPREVFANEGRRSRELLDLLAMDHGVTLSEMQLDEMTARHRDIFVSFGPMPLYPGAGDLLRTLHDQGVRLAMVTGNWRAIALAPFGELAALFDANVSAEDVACTKPDPEPYLHGLRRLGLPPERVVVVENAPLGVQAAKAAALRVIAVTTTNPPENLQDADVVIPDLRGVLHVLRMFGGSPSG